MNLTVNGGTRAEVGVGQAVTLAATLEMPPAAGQIVQYGWVVAEADKLKTLVEKPQATGKVEQYSSVLGADEATTVLDEPRPLVKVNRKLDFPGPGTYIVRLTVNGQRDGLANPADRTLLRNFQDVQVVVQ